MKLYNAINRFPKSWRKKLYYVMLPLVDFIIDRKMTKLYSQFINNGDLVFDIGANQGHMSKVFLYLGAKVVCVDPQPSAIKELEKKFKNNNKVIIVKQGVSDKPGKLKFYIAKDPKASGISTFVEDWKNKGKFAEQNFNKPVIVPVTTLDSLIKDVGLPKFCKIDVEGFEFKVLSGLSKKIKYLTFKFTKEDIETSYKCIEHLSKFGRVKFNYSTYGNYELECKEWVDQKTLIKKLQSHLDEKLFCGNVFVVMG